ncbi:MULTISPECIES: glycosyltransferase family 8 protein [unclassified Halomonas]|uniref:glycosyltransferase family 8 protein n=1 Tax=unclassified Halomonas TaxID=2609666 RepID=UPI001CF5109A|nr:MULTISPECIES: glycosyltransferase family 8 protein [unclassified Halomonas]MCA8864173.1 glycosyltransferase family 8 protein [Halomonas sp. SBBP1]UZH10205.1 glycosyltransferase family 8 protein [Halomonas sp. BDJS001]
MNIVLCADESYARYGSVVMASVIAHAINIEQIRFFMLTPGMSEETKNSLRESVERSGAALDIIDVDVAALQGFKAGRFGIAALLRLLMHRYLPADCKRIIYLDCDLLVRSDLSELWSMPLNGHTAAATINLYSSSSRGARKLPDDYFNSGVMLVDMTAWREKCVGERALACLDREGDNFRYPDQDALNRVLEGDWCWLPVEWNFQPTAYAAVEKRYPHLVTHMASLETAIHHPRIVHFIGSVKPWHAKCVHPFQEDFIAYSRHTAWPIDSKTLASSLSWRERIRMALKQPKIRRRRRLTQV